MSDSQEALPDLAVYKGVRFVRTVASSLQQCLHCHGLIERGQVSFAPVAGGDGRLDLRCGRIFEVKL